MGDERESELVGLQSELAGVALKAAMAKGPPSDPPGGPEPAGGAKARRAVRMNPLAWMAVSFLAGAVAGSLLQPVRVVRRGRDAG
ncbi:hypothetical protein V5F29_01275 [Xanthobacter aminoxidans]|uniref:hypothetical protein n=1 Tax=Xanthobacter aminoxidans TaxID=186280 RepID=UPI00372C8489